MHNNPEGGIALQDIISLDDEATIDWDAVLRDFAWASARPEENEQDQEFMLESAETWQPAK